MILCVLCVFAPWREIAVLITRRLTQVLSTPKACVPSEIYFSIQTIGTGDTSTIPLAFAF